MEDGRIPKDILYSELAKGKRTTGRPHLRFKDVCKRDLKAIGIDINGWEELAVGQTQMETIVDCRARSWRKRPATGRRRGPPKEEKES